MSRFSFWAFLVACICAAPAAYGEDVPAAKAHFDRGTTFYDLQHFAEAAKEYELAYEAKHDPAILFNIGQAYRFAGEYAKSIGAFRSFLRREPKTAQRAEIEQRIGEMQRLLDEQKRNQEKPPSGTVQTEMRPHESKPTTLEPEPSERAPADTSAPNAASTPHVATTPDVNSRRSRALMIAGGTIAAVGLGLLGGGIGSSLQAQSESDKISDPPSGYVYDPGLLNTSQALEGAFYGVGGAALAVGIGLLSWGATSMRAGHRRQTTTSPSILTATIEHRRNDGTR